MGVSRAFSPRLAANKPTPASPLCGKGSDGRAPSASAAYAGGTPALPGRVAVGGAGGANGVRNPLDSRLRGNDGLEIGKDGAIITYFSLTSARARLKRTIIAPIFPVSLRSSRLRAKFSARNVNIPQVANPITRVSPPCRPWPEGWRRLADRRTLSRPPPCPCRPAGLRGCIAADRPETPFRWNTSSPHASIRAVRARRWRGRRRPSRRSL